MAHVQRTRRPGVLRLTVLTVVVLTTVSLSVSMVAQTLSPRWLVDLPHWLLPGSPFLDSAVCLHRPCCRQTRLATWDSRSVCRISYDGAALSVTYDNPSHRIVETAVLEAHTIGELVAAWGMPTGFARYGRAINVYWRSRYASLITCTLQPDSPVERIVYHREAYPASPWRGFASSKDSQC